MTLATLQAQHPDWCFNCGLWGTHPRHTHSSCLQNPVIAALKEELAKAEAEAAESVEAYAKWNGAKGEDDAPATWDDFEAQLAEATAALVTLREALRAAADLCFAAPYDHMKLAAQSWEEALATTSHATSAAVERIRDDEREKVREREVARIMAMTEELREDCIKRGTTLEAEAAKVKAEMLKAVERFKNSQETPLPEAEAHQ